MAVTLDQSGDRCLIHLEGEVGLSSAADLKNRLLEALACGKELRVDLGQVTELGVTTLQLLWAAEREARASGLGLAVVGSVQEVVSAALRDAGFEKLPILVEAKEG